MRLTYSILATLSLSACLVTLATAAPALDPAGKCRDNGKFVDAKLCATAAPAVHCRDVKTKKFAKCGAAGTEPVPAK
ncbi:MAG: hypothetical protein ABI616_04320 [Pseudomonadota bacterium]